MAHLFLVFGIIHADTNHFRPRNHRCKKLYLVQRDALIRGIYAVIQRVPGQNNEIIAIHNTVEGLPLAQAKACDLHAFSVPIDYPAEASWRFSREAIRPRAV